MKKLLSIVLVFFLAGCAVPGNYIGSSYFVSSSTKNLKGRLLTTKIIKLDNSYLYSLDPNAINSPYKYKIGSYDVLNVIVWNHPEMTTATTSTQMAAGTGLSGTGAQSPQYAQQNTQSAGLFVDNRGFIQLPLIRNVHVAGLSTDQISHLLEKKLSKYIRHPDVSTQVTVFNSQRVHVLGEVMKPGMRPLTDRPMTILDAISLSGGINVKTADVGDIYVIRSRDLQHISVFKLNAKSPANLIVAEHFRLVNNDIVYVPPAGIISWNRIVNQILPSVQTLWFTYSMVKDLS